MLLVTTTDCLAKRYGMEQAIDMIADAGFDALDFSAFELGKDDCPLLGDGYREWALAMRQKAESRGLRFVQAHAPFPSSVPEEERNPIIKERILRAMEISALLGVEIIVVHPVQHLEYSGNVETLYRMNMEFYRSLIPHCRQLGIRIATENMWQWDKTRNVCKDSTCASPEEFCRYVDDLDSEWITACLDVGHIRLCGRREADVIRLMGGERIGALHLHDNDGCHDNHYLPTAMTGNWNEVCRALGEIGYKGNFTLESDAFLRRYDDEFIPTALKFMHDVSRYLMKKIEAASIATEQ